MYGDEINPWGDRQTVAQLWCRAKTGVAWFFFGPGPEGPGGTVFGRESHNENRGSAGYSNLLCSSDWWMGSMGLVSIV